ncbi:MAG: creatininase family protein [Candidatus Latescibacteria bacterium]|nr:creatininase family protein [Candidatus Latescibacterota bacterium]
MRDRRVFIGDVTRKEFRLMIEDGTIKAAIVPVGSTEQHHEHLEMLHDTASVAYIAQQAALELYPEVVIATPIPIGVSEHWMEHKGTLTVRPEVFAQYVYDVCDSLKRGGINTILILNGHGGNVRPIMRRIEEFKERLKVTLQFNSYWDVYDEEFVKTWMDNKGCPGHAGEYETSFAFAAFPERVHTEDIEYDDAKLGTREKGEAMIPAAVDGVVTILKAMIAGQPVGIEPRSFRPGGVVSMVR